ncbi:MAG TPA: hypothetical protein VN429_00750 [Methanospirillum sp.]|uniref:hypothetical protein n=1 Tax=Methanospirillum sp. TaxID=45200 RepID=UPI002BF489A2|nr:hypothetical protein [Methanospirillum sp.]HWQ62912.1 hypothetical protein [Methanospirillum sp.]
MGATVVYSGAITVSTETDLYTNSDTTKKSMVLKLSLYNPDSSAVAVEIWVTDGSNVHKSCLLKSSVSALAVIADSGKTILLPGYKIRFISASSTTKIEASIYEGLA